MDETEGLHLSISSSDEVAQMRTMQVQDDLLRFHGYDDNASQTPVDDDKDRPASPELDMTDIAPDWNVDDHRDDYDDYTMESTDKSNNDDRQKTGTTDDKQDDTKASNESISLEKFIPQKEIDSIDGTNINSSTKLSSMTQETSNHDSPSVEDVITKGDSTIDNSITLQGEADNDPGQENTKSNDIEKVVLQYEDVNGKKEGEVELGNDLGRKTDDGNEAYDVEEDLSIGNDEEIIHQPDLDGSTLSLSFDSTLSSHNKSMLSKHASDSTATSRFSQEAIDKFRDARKASKRGQEYRKVVVEKGSALPTKNSVELNSSGKPQANVSPPKISRRSSRGAFNLSYMNKSPSTKGMSPSPEMHHMSRPMKERRSQSNYSPRSSSIPPSSRLKSQSRGSDVKEESKNSPVSNSTFNLSYMRKTTPALRNKSPSPESRRHSITDRGTSSSNSVQRRRSVSTHQRRSQSVTKNSLYRPTTPLKGEKSYLKNETSALIGLSFNHRTKKSDESSAHQRLYRQGLEIEKKRALRKKIELEEKMSRKRLDLPTRRFNEKLPSSNGRAFDRLYDLSTKIEYDEDNYSISNRSHSSHLITDMNSTNLRLYELAKKKREMVEERELIRKEREEALNKIKPKLELATKDYKMMTPRRNISESGKDIHNRLYDLAKTRKVEDDLKAILDDNMSVSSRKVSPERMQQNFDRLYQRSVSRRKDGRRRREEIERSHAPRAPTPSRKIPVAKAETMYLRGMEKLAQMEMKRVKAGSISYESSTILKATESMDYDIPSNWNRSGRSQTPNGRGNFQTRDRSNSRGPTPRGRGRSITPNGRVFNSGFRGRSQTPVR